MCWFDRVDCDPPCPDGIDGHRTLGDKSGLAGKRDMEEDFRTGLSHVFLYPLLKVNCEPLSDSSLTAFI